MPILERERLCRAALARLPDCHLSCNPLGCFRHAGATDLGFFDQRDASSTSGKHPSKRTAGLSGADHSFIALAHGPSQEDRHDGQLDHAEETAFGLADAISSSSRWYERAVDKRFFRRDFPYFLQQFVEGWEYPVEYACLHPLPEAVEAGGFGG
ncbi:hypothetical protein [Deinococcus peraridilitoris]|uniref:hypothetical protein n=1 Tax=Deinococcus peraridilitoris TaxID=432329 RepID=UPI0012FAE0BE|nr:hypothetical protein [Deinococcus peraridilitoris]